MIGYFCYLQHYFSAISKLQEFASRVAHGDLDIPLTMDRHNIFGGLLVEVLI